MIVIYTPKVTNRIKFVFEFVFEHYFAIPFVLTESLNEAASDGDVVLVYDVQKHEKHFCIFRDNLLVEDSIDAQRVFVSRENNLPVFFQSDTQQDISFDIFSCIFYLITRYEEYLPHTPDVHGRYRSSDSILAKNEFLFRPIVEEWLLYFKEKLILRFPHLKFKSHSFQYIPTFDIDEAFRFYGRNFWKHPPNLFATNALRVLAQQNKDPYDVYDFILDEMHAHAFQPLFFFLLNDDGNQNSKISPKSKKLHKLIHTISTAHYTLGIHPSYEATLKDELLKEIDILQKISGKKIKNSRQHFLKISFPDYYTTLANTAIENDYSLAYADVAGCRAGTTQPFNFFNLKENKKYNLKIHPTIWMDATFAFYQPEKKKEYIAKEISDFILQLKKINAILVTIYHNDLLATDKYRYIFQTINQQVNKI